MVRRSCLLITAVAAAVLGVAGCTSVGSGPVRQTAGPASSSNATDSASASPTASATPSPVGSCSATATHLTYHHRVVVLGGQRIVVPPGGRRTPTVQLVHYKAYRSSAPGLGTHSGLIRAVDRHWHVHAAELGLSSGTGGGTARDGQGKRTTEPRTLAVYDQLTLYTGTFASTCGGRHVTGRYQTYGNAFENNVWCDTATRPIARRFCH